jgi:hypothetical protein
MDVEDPNIVSKPYTRMDICHWCKLALTAETFAAYDVGTHLPVCSSCIDSANELCPGKRKFLYFYRKRN